MQNDPHTPPESGIFSRLPKPSLRQRRLIAMGTAAVLVTVGLGAFALLPPVRAIKSFSPSDVIVVLRGEPGESS